MVLVGFILITKIGQSETDQRIIASKQIKSYMKQRSWTLMGFNRIRSNINEAYSNAFLYKVIEDFPTDFAKVTLTDTSDQYGLKRITSDPSMAEFETTSHKVTDYLFTLDTSDIKRPAILLIDKEHPNEDLHEN